MTRTNAEIARVFTDIADLLEIQAENPFRIRAYRNAAQTIEGLGDDVSAMVAKGTDLTELPGIGKDLAAKIRDVAQTGTCDALETLRRQLPPTLTLLLKIPGLGPKRVQTLYRQLDISTPEHLHSAAREGRIRELQGFGEKMEQSILEALDRRSGRDD
jgi:DNA polymerase (family X)